MVKTRMLFAILAAALFLLLNEQRTLAQSETPKIEIGIHSAALRLGFFDSVSPGVGGRVTYNFAGNTAFEGEVNYFPEEGYSGGTRRIQALFGLKTGLRFDKAGIFGKIRPGLIHTNQLQVQNYPCSFGGIGQAPPPPPCVYAREGRSSFALDLGAVAEFYPSRRTVVRFDIGDTIIRNRASSFGIGGFAPVSFTTHNFQFNAGVGFRF